MIQPEKITAFDVETSGKADLYGLQPYRAITGDAWLTTCATAWVDALGEIATEGLIAPKIEALAEWLDAQIEAENYIVCWNTAFDVAWLLALGRSRPDLGIRKKVFAAKWLDGMRLYQHTINAPRFREEGRASKGLKSVAPKYFPEAEGYGDDVDFNDTSPEAVAKLLGYNQLDSRYTLGITLEVLKVMSKDQLRAALIEAQSIPDVAETLVEGIRLNREAAAELGEILEDRRRTAFVQLSLNNANITEAVLSSPTKLRKVLFEDWGLPVVDLTDTGNASTDKATLAELAVTDERAGFIHEYRDAAYCKAKFSVSPQASLDYNGDGYTRPQATVFGTYTGRMTYYSKTGKGVAEQPTGVAIHQWKRDPEYRKLILPPPGHQLVEFDFAGQEFRWMAVESRDTRMLELCMPGEDAHAFMGAEIAQLDYRWLQQHASDSSSPDYKEAKPRRQLGKVGNLSLQYRTSARTLMRVAAVQHKLKLDYGEAALIWKTYRRTYRRVNDYWKRQVERARREEPIVTIAGRHVYLGPKDSWRMADGSDATWSHESTAINFPIQGVGADQKYLGLMCMHDLCIKYDARFYFELHDGMFYVVPDQYADHFVQAGLKLLSNLPYERAWNVKLPIQFPVDAKVGPSWGQLKEVHA